MCNHNKIKLLLHNIILPLIAFRTIAAGSEYIHRQESSTSCSARQPMPTQRSAEKNVTIISEPHKFFPTQIKQSVNVADAISPDAIDWPKDKSYPVIDISSWLDPTTPIQEEKMSVVNEVIKEASSSGSFNVVGHGIDNDVFERLYASAQSFFSTSVEQKMAFSSGNNLVGYVPYRNESVASIHKTGNLKEQKDLREIYSMIYPPINELNIQGPQEFHSAMTEYIEKLQSVEVALKQILTAALSSAKGVTLPANHLKDVEQDATGLLRASRYPYTPGFEDATKLLPHSDFGTITILASADEGLEEIRDGRWYKVPMSSTELHVSVGEVYTMWSNGLFKNNIHRVSKEAKRDRISFPYFTSQGKHTSNPGIAPICSDEEVPIFPQVSPKGHVMHYIKALTGDDNA